MTANPVDLRVTDSVPVKSGASNIFADLMVFQLRNLAAFMKAQKAMLDGNRTLVGQQIDISKSVLTHVVQVSQEISAEATVKAALMKCCSSVKSSMQDDIGNSNILSELSARSSAEAAEIIQTRAFEAFDEMQAMLGKMLDAVPAFAPGQPH